MPDFQTSVTVLHLFPDHYHCTLENFNWKLQPELSPAIDRFQNAFLEGQRPRLFILGDPGVGKTHVGVGLYRWGVYHTDSSSCAWIHVPTFCDRYKASMSDKSKDDPFLMVEEATRLVVLDDVFGRQITPFEIDRVLFGLIDAVQRNKAALVLTDNHEIGYFRSVLKPHESDRLIHTGAEAVFLRGESQR